MCLPNEVLVFGDCAVNPNPTRIRSPISPSVPRPLLRRFGIEPPGRVAVLFDRHIRQRTRCRGHRRGRSPGPRTRPELPVDGPLQYDAAVDPASQASNGRTSPVAGRATVLIFPDLRTGNNTYKAVQRSSAPSPSARCWS